MLSVEPILERTFFRSGAEVLLVGRSGLGAALGLVAAFAGGFFASTVVLEVVAGLDAAGLGLGRLAAAPGTAVVLVVVVVVGVVALLFTVLPAALLGRARSADGDFAMVFLASAGFVSVLMDVGLLGGEAVVLFAPAAAVTGEEAVVRGAAVVLLAAARGAVDDGGFESEVLLSGLFASVTFGLISFAVRVEGRVALLVGRLGVVEAGGPAVGLLGFLWGPGVAELGRLGLVAAAGLAFVAVGFADDVDAAGFVFFSGLGGSSLLGGAVMSFPVTASAALGSSGFAAGSCRAAPCGGSVCWMWFCSVSSFCCSIAGTSTAATQRSERSSLFASSVSSFVSSGTAGSGRWLVGAGRCSAWWLADDALSFAFSNETST